MDRLCPLKANQRRSLKMAGAAFIHADTEPLHDFALGLTTRLGWRCLFMKRRSTFQCSAESYNWQIRHQNIPLDVKLYLSRLPAYSLSALPLFLFNDSPLLNALERATTAAATKFRWKPGSSLKDSGLSIKNSHFLFN